MKLNPTLRSFFSILFGLLLFLVGLFFFRKIANSKKLPVKIVTKQAKTVFVDTVLNHNIPLQIEASGKVSALQKVAIYAEVQGVFKKSAHLFKPGQYYSKGSLLLYLDDTEYSQSIISARNNLLKQLTAALPDLKLDYPNQADKWESYAKSFDVNTNIAPLPNFSNDQEKFFITSRDIVSTYYSIKNMEEKLSKYYITAPFNGVLTETNVNTGSLVSPGQLLGTFINTKQYEIALPINQHFKDMLQVGKKVQLSTINNSSTYTGTVTRINPSVDASTQTITAYIQLSGKDLYEGMFLYAKLEGQAIENAYEIRRDLLINNEAVFIVNDTLLKKIPVQTVFFTDETAIVKGIPNQSLLINKSVPGAHEGMWVTIQ